MKLTKESFENILDAIVCQLRDEANRVLFSTADQFEDRVRKIASVMLHSFGIRIDFSPHPHGFPDIAADEFGIEVKFTTNDTWRSVANSVLETNRIKEVKFVYIVFGKMGGEPDVKWGTYESCVMHVRTSHVPRFEIEMEAKASNSGSLVYSTLWRREDSTES